MTVRRDLDLLAGQGLLDKVHGGATPPDAPAPTSPASRRSRPASATRRTPSPGWRSSMVRPGSAVGLSAGTTTWTLAHRLLEVPRHHRGHQLGADRDRLLPGAATRPDRRAHRRRPHAVRRPGRPGGRGDAAVAATSTWSSSACTAWTSAPGSPAPTSWRQRPTGPWPASARRLAVVADHTKWGVVGHQHDRGAARSRRGHHRRRARPGGDRAAAPSRSARSCIAPMPTERLTEGAS